MESEITVLGGGGLTLQSSTMSGSLSVTDGTVSLRSCTLDAAFSPTLNGVVSLGRASMTVPATVLLVMEVRLSQWRRQHAAAVRDHQPRALGCGRVDRHDDSPGGRLQDD